MRATITARLSAQSGDPVAERAVNELNAFGDWLKASNARGLISEIGWPTNADPQQWSRVLDRWYQEADRLKLPVLAFTAQGPGTTFNQLTMYRRSSGSVSGGSSIDTAAPQAKIPEAHPGNTNYWRGIDVFGGAANDGGGSGNPAVMSNTNQNTWWYENQGTFNYLASRGYTVARTGFRWERIQSTLNGALDSAELARITAAVASAAAAGMKTVLDLHNYCMYVTAGGVRMLGTSALPVSAFTDVWSRIATAFKNSPNVLAYSLMNEPHDMPMSPLGTPAAQHWEAAAQLAVDAIRATGDTHEIHVSLYEWGHAYPVAINHPYGAWITDPANNIRYEAHHYLYGNRSSAAMYPDTFATELQTSRGKWSRVNPHTTTWASRTGQNWSALSNI